MPEPAPGLSRAVAHALLGELPAGTWLTGHESPAETVAELARARPGGVNALRVAVDALRAAGPWPRPVPPELREGLGYAQLAAAVAEAVAILEADRPGRAVVADRPLTPEERRLQADVPPHHGG